MQVCHIIPVGSPLGVLCSQKIYDIFSESIRCLSNRINMLFIVFSCNFTAIVILLASGEKNHSGSIENNQF